MNDQQPVPSNTRIWEQVETTPPSMTKNFTRGGGFSGTAINATSNYERATKLFGPVGIGWGFDIIEDRYVEAQDLFLKTDKGLLLDSSGRPIAIAKHTVHVISIEFWYYDPTTNRRGSVPAFGQTTYIEQRKSGDIFTDEEAPKKSLTDAISKALSMLGFSADIHKGLYDDNKYVAGLKEAEKAEKAEKAAKKAAPAAATPAGTLAAVVVPASVETTEETEVAPESTVKEAATETEAPAEAATEATPEVTWTDVVNQFNKLPAALQSASTAALKTIANKHGFPTLKGSNAAAWAEGLEYLKTVAP
ncbi:MAG: hypothetical protein SFU83_08360 [Meiothermus sp.]|nr:hypothetical protein [Meiothermus sp.]